MYENNACAVSAMLDQLFDGGKIIGFYDSLFEEVCQQCTEKFLIYLLSIGLMAFNRRGNIS